MKTNVNLYYKVKIPYHIEVAGVIASQQEDDIHTYNTCDLLFTEGASQHLKDPIIGQEIFSTEQPKQ